jgi:hypothetical protein
MGKRLRLLCGVLAMTACVQPIAPEEEPAVVEAAPYRCSPETCIGCCVGDVCREGTTRLACGTGGQSCRACEEGVQCYSGQCETLVVPPPRNTPSGTSGGSYPPPRGGCFLSNGHEYCP